MDWVLIILGTQVIKKKRSVRPVFPDHLSVSYDYGGTEPISIAAMYVSIYKRSHCVVIVLVD